MVGNRQLSMEVISLESFPNTDNIRSKNQDKFFLYISDDNEQFACNSHDNMVHLSNKFIEVVLLVSGEPTVWEIIYSKRGPIFGP